MRVMMNKQKMRGLRERSESLYTQLERSVEWFGYERDKLFQDHVSGNHLSAGPLLITVPPYSSSTK
jgi:hypothetical protein